MCSAIERRMTLSFTNSSREPSLGACGARWGAGGGAAGRVGAGAAALVWPPTAASTSSRVTRPPRPLPRSVVGSSLCSAASFRTAGERRALPSPPPGAGAWSAGPGASVAASLTAAACGCLAAGSGLAGAAPPVSICAITAPTCTVSPWAAVILTSLPSKGEGISALTLSVITSTRGSSRLTKSPSFFSHLSTVPSVTDSPSCGILIGERAMRWNRV